MKISESNQSSLENIEKDIAELHTSSVEHIKQLFLKTGEIRAQLEKEIPFSFELLYHRMFGAFKRLEKIEKKLGHFLIAAEERQKQERIHKTMWELQRKGLLSYESEEQTREVLIQVAGHMKAIQCSHAFTLRVVSKEEGRLELTIFCETDRTFAFHSLMCADGFCIEEKVFDSIEAVVAHVAPYAMPLVQLQEVARMLETHATDQHVICHMLSTNVIEQKLSALLKYHPQGGYIVHPTNEEGRNVLMLSRIYQKGKIDHFKIDLSKHLGHYTICEERQTRLQFKRRLEQMGTPLRVRIAENEIFTNA